MSGMFKPVSPKIDFPKLEEEILSFWKKDKTFEKSVQSRPKDKTWTFLDGPPFITGMPHYGSLLSSIPKDLFPRFKTMQGYRVRRVWGWDGHGLPIENKVENELSIKRKKDIEEVIGIKAFIDKCKEYVNQVSGEWEWYVDHIGRWVDFKHAYKTWDKDYMESVMWVFKQMYEKGSIYKGLRVTLYCPHCATPISNFETALDNSYKEVPDAATVYKYQLQDEPNTFILAWSTTPWNKIVTPALAVNPKLTYVKVQPIRQAQGKQEKLILAKSTIKTLRGDYKILEEFSGTKLVGQKFVPHYNYYPVEPGEKAFVIIPGSFVTAEEGTGVVTIAAYGEEDLKAMQKHNIHIEMHLDEEGIIKPNVPKFGGMYYLKANKAVNEDLLSRGLVYIDEEALHNVPICWRCSTRLYYAPINAWFVNVQRIKEEMKKTNEKVNWFPKHFKHGRFEKSLTAAPDWCISRNRYWGSPVPVWECECGERFVPGSIAELEEVLGKKITDLHKPEIDEITIVCKKCGKKVKRVPEVLDSWIEAGSASFAERHYPFNQEEKLEQFFPPDFIVEYTGQIRAWFYVLHVISNILYKSNAYKNVVVTGVIMGTDGRKMSKNFKNYPNPKEMLQKYGGDALRLYLMGSPVMHGEDILISEEQYKMQVRGMMLILWNVYNFFVTYANADNWYFKDESKRVENSQNKLDRWILSLLNALVMEITDDLEIYDTVVAISKVKEFIEHLSNWYIRRSRERVRLYATDFTDKLAFYNTTYKVLVTLSKLLAPITPFIAEEIYKNLTGEESVHLVSWPEPNHSFFDKKIESEMEAIRRVVELTHSQRKEFEIPIKQPLISLATVSPVEISDEGARLVKDEVNVLTYDNRIVGDTYSATVDKTRNEKTENARLAREIIRKIQEERKNLGTTLNEKVNVSLPVWPKAYEGEIKRKALVSILSVGDFRVSKL